MKPWSDEDKALLREHYPKTGTMALRDMMPDRTIRQIRAMASLLGLFVDLKKRNSSTKAAWTEKEDIYLRKNYWRVRKRTDPTTKRTIAMALKRSEWEITRRASALGLLRHSKKQPHWTEEEIEFLAEHAGRSTDWVRMAMKRLGWPLRTETSIAKMRKRIGLTVVCNGSVYSAGELARLIGTSSKEICSWIKRGMLDAKPRTESIDPNHGGVGDRWEIKPESVKRFIFKHPAYIDFGAVDKDWFLSILEPEKAPRPTLRQAKCGHDRVHRVNIT